MGYFFIGVDVGGTNVKLGIISQTNRIVARSNFSTTTYTSSKNQLIDALAFNIRVLCERVNLTRQDIVGVGIGFPGLINFKSGIINTLPNIPGWNKVPLKKILQKKLRLPVVVENDVNLMTLGEWKYGAGKGQHDLVCITLGTGVGGGLVLNNELYRGPGFAAGEVGHMPINEHGPSCVCGGYGCFEQYVGRHYLQKKSGLIFGKKMEWQDVSTLARKGDKRAIIFWKETAQHIGNALTGVVNLLNPSRIIIGGGVSHCPAFVYQTINAVIKKRAMPVQASMVKVIKAKLGNDAALLGAKVLVQSVR